MRRIEEKLTEIEGRIIAHRRLLIQILVGLDGPAREKLLNWVAEREVLHDGQEDPGAVPAESAVLPLSIADEFREISLASQTRIDHP